jgi:hypothetical protein
MMLAEVALPSLSQQGRGGGPVVGIRVWARMV